MRPARARLARAAGAVEVALLAPLALRRGISMTHAAAVALVLTLEMAGFFRPIGNAIVAAHHRAAPLSATGGIVFVAVDHRSIAAVGPWPWSRRVDAELIRRLVEAGATEVFLNFDLSAPTDSEGDARLAQTLDRYGGSVVLPVFVQQRGVGDGRAAISLPLRQFRGAAWLASVNVEADRDGIVRRHPYGIMIDGEEIPSAAALLGGVLGPVESDFLVDFAIDPGTVPAVSAIDVLDGHATMDFRGKSVVVGAHALEVRRTLTVPVHGPLAGSMVQILAAETLVQGRGLRKVDAYAVILAAAVLAQVLLGLSRGNLRRAALLLSAAAVGAEALAFWLQARYALVLPSPAIISVLLVANVAAAERELNLRGRLVQLAHVETSNTERILERVIADSTDAVLVADDRLRVLRLSESARDLFGIELDAGPGSPLADVVPEEMAAAAGDALDALDDRYPAPAERRSLRFPGPDAERCIEFTVTPSRLRVSTGNPDGEATAIVCLTARDVTADWEHRERMDRLARYDTLTGAPNRTEFVRQLNERIGSSAEGCAVTVFNIHRLQTINATLGRAAGDALLAAIVERADGFDIGLSPIARLGGDRFAAFNLGPVTPSEARRTAERLARRLVAPFRLGDQIVHIGLRLGVAEGAAADDAELLLGKAELALDEARLRAGPGLRTFDQDAFARQERVRHVERAHWNALAEEQVSLTYQPQVRLPDRALVGAEALLRWKHPRFGEVAPSELIAIAEGSGFIEHLGRWALETACFDAKAWPGDGVVSVNVSPVQFHMSDVAADVERALAVSGLPPHRLSLEITETLFVGGTDAFADTFAALRALGVSLALDDFGSGYSSYGHIARLPLDKLKVDRMFVHDLDVVPFNRAVIRSVASLCMELGLTLICEGVETEAQAAALQALGCDLAQGYLFGRPEPQEAFLRRFG